jgi:2,4-dienoyl-CoA reductase-like NADH-dependent reductase (Old Yellow Enzyme family)
MAEATAVEPNGRISPGDTGIYSDFQAEAWQRMTAFILEMGAVPGIQLAHAGRKASTDVPWSGRGPIGPEEGGWTQVVGPSPIPFADGWQTPAELNFDAIRQVVEAFRQSALRSLAAGFRLVEIHAAHGYLLHQFFSPISNIRADAYGGSFENRTRIAREVVSAVREVWPDNLPLLVRVSATDYVEGGWDVEQSVRLAQDLKKLGVDLIDVSSGGNVSGAKIPIGPGYQVPFAAAIRHGAEIPTAAVGLITEANQAEEILTSGSADFIFLARELLRDPYWPRRAASKLGVKLVPPDQYARAW